MWTSSFRSREWMSRHYHAFADAVTYSYLNYVIRQACAATVVAFTLKDSLTHKSSDSAFQDRRRLVLNRDLRAGAFGQSARAWQLAKAIAVVIMGPVHFLLHRFDPVPMRWAQGEHSAYGMKRFPRFLLSFNLALFLSANGFERMDVFVWSPALTSFGLRSSTKSFVSVFTLSLPLNLVVLFCVAVTDEVFVGSVDDVSAIVVVTSSPLREASLKGHGVLCPGSNPSLWASDLALYGSSPGKEFKRIKNCWSKTQKKQKCHRCFL